MQSGYLKKQFNKGKKASIIYEYLIINERVLYFQLQLLNNMQNSQDIIKSLQQAIAKDDALQIFKFSSLLLRENPQDAEYKQCYAISAIKSKQFTELSNGLFKQKPQDKSLDKIYSYYLYSSGQYQKCIENLQGAKDHESQLLLAQSHFKVLNYQKSLNLMADLLKYAKLNKENKQLYLVNLLASSTGRSYQKVKQYESFATSNSCKQILYNFSLTLFEIGQNQKADQFLSLFEKLLEAEDEIDRITVKIFRDYIYLSSRQLTSNLRQKKVEEYKNLLKTIKDENLQCVINHNLIFLNQNHESNEHYKNLQELTDPKVKISLKQSIILRLNKLSYLNKKNRTHQAAKIVHQFQNIGDIKQNNDFIINKYFVLKKNKQFDTAENYARSVMTQKLELGFCLLVDLYDELEDRNKIIGELKSLSKTANEHVKNYIFSILVLDTNLFTQYSDYLDDLIKTSTQIKTLDILLKLYESKQDQKRQILVLNRILQLFPKNSAAKVGLAQVYLANQQIGKAQELLRGIEKPNQINDLNYLQSLEKNIHFSKKQQQSLPNEEQKKATGHKKRIKKKRRIRLPKSITSPTPGFKPDPERWLAKWQRKGYKKKGKKGGNKTQGLSTVGMQEKNVFNAGNSTSAKQVTKQTKKRR